MKLLIFLYLKLLILIECRKVFDIDDEYLSNNLIKDDQSSFILYRLTLSDVPSFTNAEDFKVDLLASQFIIMIPSHLIFYPEFNVSLLSANKKLSTWYFTHLYNYLYNNCLTLIYYCLGKYLLEFPKSLTLLHRFLRLDNLSIDSAGDQPNEGLRGKAGTLYDRANALYGAIPGAESAPGKQEAKALKDAVGAGELSGLTQALANLAGANAGNLPTLAKDAKDKYNDVKSKFEAVQKQKAEGKYTEYQDEYGKVEKAWNAFNNLYKEALKAEISTSILIKELQTAAKALQNKANSDGNLDTLKGHAGQLATNAGLLASSPSSSTATNVIENYDSLETEYNGLNTEKDKVSKEFEAVKHIYNRMLNIKKAGKLKDQVGDGNDEKIWKKAKELYTRADNLANASGLQPSDPPEQKELKEELKGLATALATAVGKDDTAEDSLQKALKELKDHNGDSTPEQKGELVRKAKEVIKHYDAVKEAYENVKAKQTQYTTALSDGEKTKYTEVESKFTQLQQAYDEGKCKDITPIYDKESIR
ncbi:uncharacterized protein TA15055 [Theileria annulata]|uniref:Tpr-related protein family member n=1 Tax=Theileria annulata TaxID=5874 RepID=Q4UFV0_THEAN|nr:uncharacterized protein TA15055 [Theileria annulata]CAI74208.1 hypothetical protein TA15055 [Theileria annulata]|eukprot:XP_951940.1 hypothetical protein TA15055 [Theileria annulata]